MKSILQTDKHLNTSRKRSFFFGRLAPLLILEVDQSSGNKCVLSSFCVPDAAAVFYLIQIFARALLAGPRFSLLFPFVLYAGGFGTFGLWRVSHLILSIHSVILYLYIRRCILCGSYAN